MSALVPAPVVSFERTRPLSDVEVLHVRDRLGSASYASHISGSHFKAAISILANKIFLSPLIYFEAFCVSMWTVTKYTTYAVVIVALVVVERFFAIRQSYQTWLHLDSISSRVDSQQVTVIRLDDDGRELKSVVLARELVTGDHIVILPEMHVPCDCMLIRGEVIADISIITGESKAHRFIAVPPGKSVRLSNISSSLLLCGSKVLRTRASGGLSECRAIVMATAFGTIQGSFLLSVLSRNPSPAEERIKGWMIKSMGILVGLGILSMIYSYYASESLNLHHTEVFVRVFDMLTDALPPALPVALSIATITTAVRLPSYISTARSGRPTHLLAGLVTTVVLDKTNTVTTSEMSVTGVLEADSSVITLVPSRNSMLEVAVAACNYLAVLGTQLVGDPVEVALMKAIDWEVDKDDDSFVKRVMISRGTSPHGPSLGMGDLPSGQIGALNFMLQSERNSVNSAQILASFPFNPATMRMSVVARLSNSDSLFAFSKGAPEAIIRLCDPDSIPYSLETTLERLSSLGYRILAYSSKKLNRSVVAHTVRREECEKDMKFSGIVLLSNDLHPNSRDAIRDLRNSSISVILCTGDSSGTAVAVARQAGITGKINGGDIAYPRASNSLHDPLLEAGNRTEVVFARMTPDDKAVFVEKLAKSLKMGAVLMCGDGPNDTKALCAADVGVVVNAQPNTLLEAAAGCMACLDPSVGLQALVDIITQGRSALAVLFCIAKIVIAYAVIEGTCVTLCYSVGTNLTDLQYFVVDMFLVLPTVLLLSVAPSPAESIDQTQPLPPFRILAIGLGFHCCLCIVCQLIAISILKLQDWYIPFQPSPRMLNVQGTQWEHTTDDLDGFENTVLFLMCCFQCILLIAIFVSTTLDTWCKSLEENPITKAWIRILILFMAVLIMAVTLLGNTSMGILLQTQFDLVSLRGMYMAQMAIILASHIAIASLWEWRILPRLSDRLLREIVK